MIKNKNLKNYLKYVFPLCLFLLPNIFNMYHAIYDRSRYITEFWPVHAIIFIYIFIVFSSAAIFKEKTYVFDATYFPNFCLKMLFYALCIFSLGITIFHLPEFNIRESIGAFVFSYLYGGFLYIYFIPPIHLCFINIVFFCTYYHNKTYRIFSVIFLLILAMITTRYYQVFFTAVGDYLVI